MLGSEGYVYVVHSHFCLELSCCYPEVAMAFRNIPPILSPLIRTGHQQQIRAVQAFSSVQSLSRVQLFATAWTTAWQASASITNSQSLLKLMSIESLMPSKHYILCHPLLLLPSSFPSISEVKRSHSVVSDSLQPHGLQTARLFCSQDFPGNSPGVDCHFLLQGIFPTQGLSLGLPHCRQTLYHLSHQGSPSIRVFSNESAL